jgi:hypothetical protein
MLRVFPNVVTGTTINYESKSFTLLATVVIHIIILYNLSLLTGKRRSTKVGTGQHRSTKVGRIRTLLKNRGPTRRDVCRIRTLLHNRDPTRRDVDHVVRAYL